MTGPRTKGAPAHTPAGRGEDRAGCRHTWAPDARASLAGIPATARSPWPLVVILPTKPASRTGRCQSRAFFLQMWPSEEREGLPAAAVWIGQLAALDDPAERGRWARWSGGACSGKGLGGAEGREIPAPTPRFGTRCDFVKYLGRLHTLLVMCTHFSTRATARIQRPDSASLSTSSWIECKLGAQQNMALRLGGAGGAPPMVVQVQAWRC